MALTAAVSGAVGMDLQEALTLAGLAVAAAVAAGVVGGVVLTVVRRSSLAVQAVVVTMTAVSAVAAGALAAGADMYVAQEDLRTLAVMLVAGGTVGVLTALVLGQRVVTATRSLQTAARRLGDGDTALDLGDFGPAAGAELAALARELERSAARLEEARASERALEASRRELVAWVSHDLRTPLAGIRAVTEALEDGVVDDPVTVARYYRTLRQEADRLAELVDDLFELSRIQAGTLRLQMERASLGDVVSDALAAADPVAAAKGVHLEGRLIEQPPDLVLSVPEVSRVLRNLLENAIRHTPSDGTVWVEAGVAADAAYVSVADSCGGIDPAELERVFDLAFRGVAARTPEADARAGLGLAIAKGLVTAHAGDIAVENEGPGCCFTVHLPLPSDRSTT
ncbi:MAG: HAMP domain-containing histidine kinase [Actinomycetota bacterium]|nr:HAMP domain-containing histidine kinase [Actinomycetota bacterium]